MPAAPLTDTEICASCEAERRTSDAPCERCGASTLLRGRYRLEARLARGAVGIVFRARRLLDGRPVAIKRLQFHAVDRIKALELFEREASVLGQLEHPAIPRFYEWIEAGEGRNAALYIVLELIEGESLDDYLKTHRLSERDVLELVRDLLPVLAYMHQRVPPVVHRDIKPGNLLIREGHEARIALVDFGSVHLAEALADDVGTTVTGTVGYMAPEQMRGRATPASDLYGVGALMLCLLTRKDPATFFGTTNVIELPKSLAVRSSTLRLLARLLAPVAARRLGTVEEASHELERCLGLLDEPDRGPLVLLSRLPKPAVAAAAALAVIGVLGGYQLQTGDTSEPRPSEVSAPPPAVSPPPPREEVPAASGNYEGLLAELPRREIPLADGISEVDLACFTSVKSTCRFLLLERAASRRLDIVDLRTLRLAHSIDLPSSDTLIAASNWMLVLVVPQTRELQRWSLDGKPKMLSKRTLDIEGVPKALAMGSHGSGPILVVSAKGEAPHRRIDYSFFDPASLEELHMSAEPALERVLLFGYPPDVRASADGRTFALSLSHGQGLGVISVLGKANVEASYLHSSATTYAMPSARGERLYARDGVHTSKLVPVAGSPKPEQPHLRSLPAETSGLRLELTPSGPNASRGFALAITSGDARRRLLDLGRAKHLTERGDPALALPDRVHFLAERGLLLLIPDSADRLEAISVDVRSELRQRRRDFLFVMQTPRVRARRGSFYGERLQGASSAGASRFEVVTGPAGLAMSGGTQLAWRVMEDVPIGRHPTRLRLFDKSGQEAFYELDILVE